MTHQSSPLVENVAVNEDSGAQNIAWATGIAAAQGLLATPVTASDENTQTVSFNVSSNNPGLFSVQPEIASDGRLTFTPAANAFVYGNHYGYCG